MLTDDAVEEKRNNERMERVKDFKRGDADMRDPFDNAALKRNKPYGELLSLEQ